MQFKTIDEEAIPLLVNGHRLKFYKISLWKKEFIDGINKTVMVVEQVLSPASSNHWGKKKKNKDSGENLHEAPEPHYWVENFLGWPNGVKK